MDLCVVQHDEMSETMEPTPAERLKFTLNKHWVSFNTRTLEIYHEFGPVTTIVDIARSVDANMSRWIFMYRSSGRRRLMNKDMTYAVLRSKYIYYIQVQPENYLYDIKNALIKFCKDNQHSL